MHATLRSRISPLLLAFAASAASAQETPPVERTPAVPAGAPAQATHPANGKAPVYDESADAPAAVAAAVARAQRDHKRVLIQWGANWCVWCVALHHLMASDPDLAHELLYEYEVVRVDMGHFDKNKELATKLEADFQAIPFLTLLDGDGHPLVQQRTEPFELGSDGKVAHDPKKLLAFLKEYEAPHLDAKQVREGALAAAKASHRRVFLHYGAPWCGWCHRLEDWLARPEVAALLAKDFVEVKIDTDRMVGGKEALAADHARTASKDGGIPWFLFLDGDGEPLATSDRDGANVGFPYQDEEIAWFGTMLEKARVNLTGDDVKQLTASLHAIRAEDEKRKAARKSE